MHIITESLNNSSGQAQYADTFQEHLSQNFIWTAEYLKMVNSLRVSILSVWEKVENKKENYLPNLSRTIKCGSIALWKGQE